MPRNFDVFIVQAHILGEDIAYDTILKVPVKLLIKVLESVSQVP